MKMHVLVALAGVAAWGQPTITPNTPPVVSQGATVKFSANQPVTWSLVGGSVGTIDPDGTYHSPARVVVPQSLGGCQLLPPNHIFNTRADSLPVRSNSASLMSVALNSSNYGLFYAQEFPLNYINADTLEKNLVFAYTGNNNGPFQIPSALEGAVIQGGLFVNAFISVDRHFSMIRPDTCDVQELYNYYNVGENLVNACPLCNSQSGVRYNAMKAGLPLNGATDAASMMLWPLTLRISELQDALASNGSIRHALRATLKNSQLGALHEWPAVANAAAGGSIPYGTRIRLKSSFSCASTNPVTQLLIRQQKEYGMFFVDGSTIPFEVTVDMDSQMTPQIAAAFTELSNTGICSTARDNMEFVDQTALAPPDVTAVDAGLVRLDNGVYTPPVFAAVKATSISSHQSSVMHVLLRGVALDFPEKQVVLQAGAAPTQLVAYVSGATDSTLQWSISPSNVGALSPDGVYTPPTTLMAPVALAATATSNADPLVRKTMTVLVLPPGDLRLRMNTTSSNYTDTAGKIWYGMAGSVPLLLMTPGTNYDNGPLVGAPVSNEPLYRPVHYSLGDQHLRLRMPNGNYKATLKLSNGEYPAGKNFVNVESQGKLFWRNIDVSELAGGMLRPYDLEVPVQVVDGTFRIGLRLIRDPGTHTLISSALIEPDPDPPHLTIQPSATGPIETGQTRQFWAQGWHMEDSVTWSLAGPGTISASGLYRTPATPPTSDTTITITATSTADPTKTAAITFTWTFGQLQISVISDVINRQNPISFSALLGGSPYTNVTWSVTPVGSIHPSAGVYTPPDILEANAAVTITATSLDDPTRHFSKTVTVSAITQAIRINAGWAFGPTTDAQGNVWLSDSANSPYWTSVAGSMSLYADGGFSPKGSPPELYPVYQSRRYGTETSRFYFSTPVPNGTYRVRLLWCEMETAEAYAGDGPYRFDVLINGRAVLPKFDPVKTAGGLRTAFEKIFTVPVTTGNLRIDFAGQSGAGRLGVGINGLEIIEIGPLNSLRGGSLNGVLH